MLIGEEMEVLMGDEEMRLKSLPSVEELGLLPLLSGFEEMQLLLMRISPFFPEIQLVSGRASTSKLFNQH